MTCFCIWQVPQGATPRSLVIHLRGTLTRTCKPGDSVTVAGVFLPQPYTGFRAMRAGLLTTTYLDAMSVTQDKRSYKDTAADGTLRAQIEVSASSLYLVHGAWCLASRCAVLACSLCFGTTMQVLHDTSGKKLDVQVFPCAGRRLVISPAHQACFC